VQVEPPQAIPHLIGGQAQQAFALLVGQIVFKEAVQLRLGLLPHPSQQRDAISFEELPAHLAQTLRDEPLPGFVGAGIA
jgi:hypothetical protein